MLAATLNFMLSSAVPALPTRRTPILCRTALVFKICTKKPFTNVSDCPESYDSVAPFDALCWQLSGGKLFEDLHDRDRDAM